MGVKRRRSVGLELRKDGSSGSRSRGSNGNFRSCCGVILAMAAARSKRAYGFFSQPRPSMLTSRRIHSTGPGSLLSSIDLNAPIVPSSAGCKNFLVQLQKANLSPSIVTNSLVQVEPPPLLAVRKEEEVKRTTSSVERPLCGQTIARPELIQTYDKQSPRTFATASPRLNTTTLQRWKRRLITREDWKHMHKITGVSFLLSSWGLSAYGIRDLFAHGWTQSVASHGRPFVGLLLVLLTSSVVQSFSSISMACKYRRNQPAIRNTFICNAFVTILGSVSALWSSPWYPTALNGAPSMLFYLIMDAIGLIGMGDNLIRLQSLIASRQTTSRKRKRDDNKRLQGWSYWKDVFVYMMPILIGAPFFVAIGWQFGIQHDRTFYLNLIEQSYKYPHLQAGAVYGMVMVAMGASYSSLIVTLRDKKLISKQTEGLSLTAIMICLIGSLYQAMRDPGTIGALLGL